MCDPIHQAASCHSSSHHQDPDADGASASRMASIFKTMPEGVLAFFGAMTKTGYMIPLLSGTQTIVGALLLLNRCIPLALAIIAPVIVNIIAFHVFLASSGLPAAFVVLTLELYLAWAYRKMYRSMLVMLASPD
jgi:hypothetical protein